MISERKKGNDQKADRMGRVINFRPVFTFALFLIAGILIGYFRVVKEKPMVWAILLTLFLPWIIFFFVQRKMRFVAYMVGLYSIFFLGISDFSISVSRYEDTARYNGEYSVCGVVVEKSLTDAGGEIVLTDLMIDGQHQRGRLVLQVDRFDYAAFDFCDEVALKMRVSTVSQIDGKYGFRAEAIADRECYRGADLTSIEITGRRFYPGAFLRGRLQESLYRGMGEEAAALSSAILLGNTSGIEEGFLQNVRYGGVAHIFAVSGLHIGAVFAFCLLIFRRKRNPAPVRFVIIAAILLLYGGICGYSASVVRAIVTCLTLYGSTLLGVKYDGLESLSLAACIVFLAYPTLLFGVGAQLSFSACIGISLLSSPIRESLGSVCFGTVNFVRYRLLKHSPPRKADMFRGNTLAKPLTREVAEKGISFLSVSIAAQLGTLPVLYASFGYLSTISLLLNCLFVPLISVGFSPLLFFALVACVLPSGAGAVVLYFPNVLLHAFALPFHFFDFSNGIIASFSLPSIAFVCYYAAVLAASGKMNLPVWQRRVFTLLFFGVFFLTLTIA